MAGQWEKVARWAGMGNNRRDGAVGLDGEMMVEESAMSTEENEISSAQGSVETIQAGGEDAAEINDVDPGALLQLRAELEQARAERDKLLDRQARLQAEFENARRREVKERADARDYAVQGAVEPFLGVMDNFQLALRANGTAEQLRGGVELILKQMEEALRSLQVQSVETVGAMFDPRVHEALGSIETTEHPDHQVLEEIRRGYKLREKLLRPAMVRIASNPAQVSE